MPLTKTRGFLLVKCDSLPITLYFHYSVFPYSVLSLLRAFRDRLAAKKNFGPELRPLRVLVQRDDRVDHLEGKRVEMRVDAAACGHAVAFLENRLPLARQQEVGKEQRGVR